MGTNYLKRYYLNDAKLAQRARLEFFRALGTGRMVAFVGSMATQAFGYGSWAQLRMQFAAIAHRVAEGDAKRQKQILDFYKYTVYDHWNGNVGLSMMEEALEGAKSIADEEADPSAKKTAQSHHWPHDHYYNAKEQLRVLLAKKFRQPMNQWRIDRDPVTLSEVSFNDTYNVPRALWNDLLIRRFVTSNYDFELERVAMLADQPEFEDPNKQRTSPFAQLLALRANQKENFQWDVGSGRIRRTFADGWAIESDLLNRERIDRLIEFAVGTDDVDGHIMHLHGRACTPASMIVTQSDYDALYRRDDLNRRPFEFAKKMMMGGNPILFVGLGMGEAELNTELHEFVSNNPYQRVAPVFVLWSTRTGQGEQMPPEQIQAKRVDFLRRLGVLIIFDNDLQDIKAHEKGDGYIIKNGDRRHDGFDRDSYLDPDLSEYDKLEWDLADKSWREDLKDLRYCVKALCEPNGSTEPDPYHDPTIRERHIGTHWRTMQHLVDYEPKTGKPTVLWEVQRKNEKGEQLEELDVAPEGDYTTPEEKYYAWSADFRKATGKHDILCIIGSQGCGKGFAARQLAMHGHGHFKSGTAGRTLLINGCFCFDTDSLLDFIKRFLVKQFGDAPDAKDEKPNTPPTHCRQTAMAAMKLHESANQHDRCTIIMNGSERFFDLAGRPLSAELDQMLQLFKNARAADGSARPRTGKVQWVFFGTDRVRDYMTELGAEIVEFDDVFPESKVKRCNDTVPSFYLNELIEASYPDGKKSLPSPVRAAIDSYNANYTSRISSDGMILRKAAYNALLHDEALNKAINKGRESRSLNPKEIHMVRDIMRMLTFIGQPVEGDVLSLLISRDDQTAEDSKATQEAFTNTIEKLVLCKIVLQCRGFIGEDMEPSDKRYLLHRSILTELRHRFGIPLSEAKLSTAFNMSLYIAQPIDGDIPDSDLHDDLGAAVDELLRAYRKEVDADALKTDEEMQTLARPFGKSSAILLDHLSEVAEHCGSSRRPSSSTDAKGRCKIATEMLALCGKRQVSALRAALALVRSYYSTTGLLTLDSGDRALRDGRDGVLLEHAERLDNVIDGYGKCSLAREKLRALLNNDSAFNEAFGSAEPFYPDELVWLHNERGVVRLAMGDLYEARRSFDLAMDVNRKWVEANDRSHNWRRIRLNQIVADIEMGDLALAERKCVEIQKVSTPQSAAPLREDQLSFALADGMMAWIEHLRGRSDPALALYDRACRALSDLGEVRAQSYFERMRANAYGKLQENERRITLERAMDLAESAVQMDLVHRLRVDWADSVLFSREIASAEERQRANRYLEEAISYSIHAEVHRVRLEAAMATSRARLAVSDFEGALRFAMDAMMIATRYGMELRKITLRATLAKIMAARGHPVTAENLARTCIKMATRLRFQTAIDKASQVIIDIPRISAAIAKSDQSGRRNF